MYIKPVAKVLSGNTEGVFAASGSIDETGSDFGEYVVSNVSATKADSYGKVWGSVIVTYIGNGTPAEAVNITYEFDRDISGATLSYRGNLKSQSGSTVVINTWLNDGMPAQSIGISGDGYVDANILSAEAEAAESWG